MAIFRPYTLLEQSVRRPPLAHFLVILLSLLTVVVITLGSTCNFEKLQLPAKLWRSPSSSSKIEAVSSGLSSSAPGHFIVLPVTGSNERFCRSLSAFLINGYKSPIAINWGGTSGGNHYTKIQTGLDWLNDGGHDDDIVVILDALDVYPQLPPDAFFQQVREYPNRPSVLIGAEKRCYPGPPQAARCTRMPDSPLPDDIYGKFTDIVNKTGKAGNDIDVDPDLDDPSSWVFGMFERIRPKYINSGTLVGTRGQLKIVYTEGAEIIDDILAERDTAAHWGSDQEIFQRVYLERQAAGLEAIPAPEVHMHLFQNAGHSYKDLFPRQLNQVAHKLNYYQRKVLGSIASKSEWGARQIAYNHIANTVPSFMHFPGYKAGMQIWWGRMWWMQREDKGIFGYHRWTGRDSRPLAKFMQHASTHQGEEDGYGIKLPNGTWHSYAELCEPFFQNMLDNTHIPPKGTGLDIELIP